MKNVFSIMFTLFVMVFMFTACEDKDEPMKPDMPTCEVACDEATEACVCKDDKCACEKKEAPAPTCEPACEDDSECKCTDSKCACEKKEVSAPTCAQECTDGNECKCVDSECACVPKTPEQPKCGEMKCTEDEECVCSVNECKCEKKTDKPELKCEPACNNETEECACVDDKCECKLKEVAVEECFCDEGKTVKCPEGGKEACVATPNDPVAELKCEPACAENKECVKGVDGVPACVDKVVENLCKDKAENDECGKNKVCMKTDGDKLACMDKPVEEQMPVEPEK